MVDKNTSNSQKELKSAVEPLERSNVKVIPVSMGMAADTKTLTTITTNPANLLVLKKSESPASIGRQIMNKALTGNKVHDNVVLMSCAPSCDCMAQIVRALLRWRRGSGFELRYSLQAFLGFSFAIA